MNSYVDNYCERLAPGFWGEPINALTNLAFILAAILVWKRFGGERLLICRILTANLFLIGIGSFLFHTLATGWAAMADVLPILSFILIYLFAANRHFLGMRVWMSLALVVCFFPYAFAVGWLTNRLFPFIGSSSGYVPVALLILVYGLILLGKLPGTARGLMVGAAILSASIAFRAIDVPLCGANPLGTHMLWHLLNAAMLAWMIELLRYRMVQAGKPH